MNNNKTSVLEHTIEEDSILKDFLSVPSADLRNSVEYFLQLSFNNPHISLQSTHSKIWQIDNQHLNLKYAKQARGLQRVQVLVDINELDPQYNSLHQLLSNGITFPSYGMMFNTGQVKPYIDNEYSDKSKSKKRSHKHNEDHSQNDSIKQYLVCELALGKPFPLREYMLEDGTPDIPNGYHSFSILSDTEEDNNIENDKNNNSPTEEKHNKSVSRNKDTREYSHRFVMVDSTRCLPLYLIQLDLSSQNRPHKEKCAVCESRTATVYCEEDKAALCDTCDRAVHGANKLVERHTRVSIRKKRQRDFGTCSFHIHENVQYFCPQCQIPVCVHCKMVGNHSTGNSATHKLIPIKEAYKCALAEAVERDSFIEKRKHILRDQKALIEKKVEVVNRNAKEIDDQIYEMLKTVITQLSEIQNRKLDILKGEAVELDRLQNEIEWAENFLRYQKDHAKPVQFLMAWQRHQKYRQSLHKERHVSHFSVNVKADIQLRGIVEATETNVDVDTEFPISNKENSPAKSIDHNALNDRSEYENRNSKGGKHDESVENHKRTASNALFREQLFTNDGLEEIPVTKNTRRLSQISNISSLHEMDLFLKNNSIRQ